MPGEMGDSGEKGEKDELRALERSTGVLGESCDADRLAENFGGLAGDVCASTLFTACSRYAVVVSSNVNVLARAPNQ